MFQKALLFSFAALALFGTELAITHDAILCSSCANSHIGGIALVQDYGSSNCDRVHRACAEIGRQLGGLRGTMAEAGPGGGAGSVRPVLLREIQSQTTISVAPHVTLDFSDGGANNVTVMKSDDLSVVQITSKTNVVTVAPGTAHLRVANFGHCPKSTDRVVFHCGPIPVYSVTINVGSPP